MNPGVAAPHAGGLPPRVPEYFTSQVLGASAYMRASAIGALATGPGQKSTFKMNKSGELIKELAPAPLRGLLPLQWRCQVSDV